MKALSIAFGLSVVLGLSACETVNRGSFGPFKRAQNNTSYGYAVIDDTTGSAPTKLVERFEVRPGDCSQKFDCKNDRERSEIKEFTGHRLPRALGTTNWYGWSFYVPEDFVDILPTNVVLGQFHQEDSHPVWLFTIDDHDLSGGFHLDDQVYGSTKTSYKFIDESDLRGKWHRIEVHAKWTKKDDGFFKVWINGEQKVDYSGQTMTATKIYFKYGLYRSYMSRYKNATGSKDVPGQVVYYANVRRANSRESLTAR